MLANRVFARHEIELKRQRKVIGAVLWEHFAAAAKGIGVWYAAEQIRRALNAFEKHYRRRTGMWGKMFLSGGGGARERARRRRQIARGQLTESNGLVRGAKD